MPQAPQREPTARQRLILDLHSNVLSRVPGGDSALTCAPAPGGGLWIVKEADSAALLHLDPATGAVQPAGRFVAEIEQGTVLFGAPPALWLFAVP